MGRATYRQADRLFVKLLGKLRLSHTSSLNIWIISRCQTRFVRGFAMPWPRRLKSSSNSSFARLAYLLPRACRVIVAFQRDRRGSVLPLIGLAVVPLLAATGAAVDYSRALALRTAMQGSLDSTALRLAVEDVGNVEQAQQIFGASFAHPEVYGVSVSGKEADDGGTIAVSLTATGSMKTDFMSIMGYDTMALKVQSTASKTRDDSGCVLALSTTASGSVSDGGSADTTLTNCSVFSNSKAADSVAVGGSAVLTARSIGTVGNVSLSGNVMTTDGIRTSLRAIADPYYDATYPSFSGCTANNLNVNKSTTINPGVYCNGLSVNAGSALTLNPGIYYIDRGSFTVNGGATITGTGVTLVFTSSTGSNWATASINGNATVDLTAPIAGPTAGIVIFGDRQIPTGTTFKFNGGATQYLGGAVYVPTGALSYAGGSGSSTSCTKIIGDTVNFTGNASLAINCSSLPVKNFGATVVRLKS